MLLGVRVPHSVGSTNFVAMSCVESPHHGGSHPRLHPRQAGEEVRPLAASSPLHHRQASSPTHHHHNHHRHHQHHHHHHHHRNDRYAPIKRLALVQIHPPRNPNKPLTPFSISDILTGRANRGKSDRERQDGHRGRDDRDKQRPAAVNNHAAANPGQGNVTLGMGAIVRPWADSLSAVGRHSSVGSEQEESGSEEDEEIEVDDDPDTVKKFSADSSQSPLDALLQMTSKTFDGMDAASQHSEGKWFHHKTAPSKHLLSTDVVLNSLIPSVKRWLSSVISVYIKYRICHILYMYRGLVVSRFIKTSVDGMVAVKCSRHNAMGIH